MAAGVSVMISVQGPASPRDDAKMRAKAAAGDDDRKLEAVVVAAAGAGGGVPVPQSAAGDAPAAAQPARGAEAKAKPEAEKSPECNICFETIGKGQRANLCRRAACTGSICRVCAYGFLMEVSGRARLHCPEVRCPSCAGFVRWSHWKKFNEAAAARCASAAWRALTLQCGGCDNRETLINNTEFADNEEAPHNLGNAYVYYASFSGDALDAMRRFGRGDRGAAADVVRLLNEAGEISPLRLAMCMTDPERASVLALAALRVRPAVTTACCGYRHCFQCKVLVRNEGEHDSPEACADFRRRQAAELDFAVADARLCPGCTAVVVRSEGCNSVQCPCGQSFNYADAKRLVDK